MNIKLLINVAKLELSAEFFFWQILQNLPVQILR